MLLTHEDARALLDVEEVRSLFVWHALEESEHKAVAFDVYQTVSGRHWVRVGVMNLTTLGFLLGIAAAGLLSLVEDPVARRHPGAALRSIWHLRHSPWIAPGVVRRIRDYNRRDFHPDDYDNRELTADWCERLFGPGGSLQDRVWSAGAA